MPDLDPLARIRPIAAASWRHSSAELANALRTAITVADAAIAEANTLGGMVGLHEAWQQQAPSAQRCRCLGSDDNCSCQGEHPDDVAVTRFAAAMRAKLALARGKGRDGWQDKALCSDEELAASLIHHLGKGNAGTFEDVANFAMMLHQRGADPLVLAKEAGATIEDAAILAMCGGSPELDPDFAHLMQPAEAGWGWWSGYDGEHYGNGPFATRAEAVAALSGEAGYIVEACQDPVDLASYVDAEDLLERAEGVAYDLSNEDGDPIFEAKPEQIADLGKRLKAACDAWQVAHGLTFTPYRFTASRNEAWIEAIDPIDLGEACDAGVVDHA
ncbi:hypothetical protein ACN9JG_06105 [Cereibacter azotoformans]|uniref:hypothetical protein n=1 Tax=Cereibacter azotoformans TaxID=43057 RepID=UPI003B20DA5D